MWKLLKKSSHQTEVDLKHIRQGGRTMTETGSHQTEVDLKH